MGSHGGSILKHAAVFEIHGDAGRSKRVIADKGLIAGSRCTPGGSWLYSNQTLPSIFPK
jgi:hypothetical protein